MVGGTPYPVCQSSWGYLPQEKQLPGGKFWKSFQEGPLRHGFFSPSNNCVNPTMIYITCIEHWTLLIQLQNWQSSMRPWWRFGAALWCLVQIPQIATSNPMPPAAWRPVAHTTMVFGWSPSDPERRAGKCPLYPTPADRWPTANDSLLQDKLCSAISTPGLPAHAEPGSPPEIEPGLVSSSLSCFPTPFPVSPGSIL